MKDAAKFGELLLSASIFVEGAPAAERNTDRRINLDVLPKRIASVQLVLQKQDTAGYQAIPYSRRTCKYTRAGHLSTRRISKRGRKSKAERAKDSKYKRNGAWSSYKCE